MIICKIDQSQHDSFESLNLYLRRFKIKQADYYTEYEPRFDLLTKEVIPFKDISQYFSQDFVDKRNLKKWLKENLEEGKKWAIEWLKKRKENKGLIYAPSQVELKSLSCPTILYYDSVGGYYNICKELGFLDRYLDQVPIFNQLPKKTSVVTDTREQLPLTFQLKNKNKKLEVGDYGLSGKNNKGIYIERKSLADFANTLNARKIERKGGDDSSLRRFDRELTRALDLNNYIVMVVESTLSDALSFDYLPQMKWTKVKPSHVFKNLRDMLTKYPLNFQAVFVDGRLDAANKIIKIFEMGEQVKNIDLQYAAEKGLI